MIYSEEHIKNYRFFTVKTWWEMKSYNNFILKCDSDNPEFVSFKDIFTWCSENCKNSNVFINIKTFFSSLDREDWSLFLPLYNDFLELPPFYSDIRIIEIFSCTENIFSKDEVTYLIYFSHKNCFISTFSIKKKGKLIFGTST